MPDFLRSQVEEVKERMFSGSESSRAMREIRTRDPGFDLNTFVRAIKVRGRCYVLLSWTHCCPFSQQ